MKTLLSKRSFKYALIFIVLVLLLSSMAVKPFITMIFGQKILIKTQAYDPRDVFRGDYIQLSFDISEINKTHVEAEILNMLQEKHTADLHSKPLYVHLSQQGKYYYATRVTLDRPKEGIYLKAKFSYVVWDNKDVSKVKSIIVDYALDKYYVPENTGKELEKKIQKGEAYAVVKVLKGFPILVEVAAEE